MNQDPVEQKLRELNWRRELTAAEQAELRAWLAAHPEAQADWQMEAALSKFLAQLPEAPVPSNFTARVLQAVELETQTRERAPQPAGWWHLFVPRAAVVAIVVGLGLFGYHRYEVTRRVALVRDLAVVAEVKSLPATQAFEDFDAIRSMTPAADTDLLALNDDLLALQP